MNNQQAFNKMVQHLRAQNATSKNNTGRCAYRGLFGRKCAVGALIPDEEYRTEFEDVIASTVVQNCPSLQGIDKGLLDSMQNTHDNVSIRFWEDEFKEIAEEFDLYVPHQ